MSKDEENEFYNRPGIQKIVRRNRDNEAEKIDKQALPAFVQQVNKQTRSYYNASIKGKKTRAYETKVKIGDKTYLRFRDPLGRFARRLLN